MPEDQVLYRKERETAYLTINREAQRNAITPEAIALFLEYLDRAEADSDVRAVLITGAGEKAFCTGAQLGDGVSAEGEKAFRDYARLLKRLATFPKPTVARVKGYCLAGGMGFMLACDIVIASDDSRFGTPEVNVGLWPMMIGALIFRNVLQKEGHGDDPPGGAAERPGGIGHGADHPGGAGGQTGRNGGGDPAEPCRQESHRHQDRQGGLP